MTSRELPPAEWSKVAHTEAGPLLSVLPPESRILVIEDGPLVLGCFVLFPRWHADLVWIHPEHRGKAGVFRALARSLRSCGVPQVLIGVTNGILRRFCEHYCAVKVPGETFVWGSN